MRSLAILLLSLVLAGCFDAGSKAPDFSALVERTAPAVVHIRTIPADAPSVEPALSNPFPEGSALGELFRYFFGEPEEGEGGEGALGSGFILEADGYILTNQHVIADAKQIVVRLSDRRELLASVVGEDATSDIALLKVEARGLPTLRVGNADRLRVGEWVLAIGTPFGFDHSVSAGIVSAKGRGIPDASNQTYVPFIQTDVAINPGSSGGPLINMRGEVVGVNAQIYTESGGYMGLSFAIPINLAMDVVAQLKQRGRVSRGFLGVLVQDMERDLAAAFGLDRPLGALVVDVLPDSPAARGGLRPGDVVLEVDGTPLADASGLPMLIGRIPPGKEARLRVWRDGAPVDLRIEVGMIPDEAAVPSSLLTEPGMLPTQGPRGLSRPHGA